MKKKTPVAPIIASGPFGQLYTHCVNIGNENGKGRESEPLAARSKQPFLPHRPIDKSAMEPFKSNATNGTTSII